MLALVVLLQLLALGAVVPPRLARTEVRLVVLGVVVVVLLLLIQTTPLKSLPL